MVVRFLVFFLALVSMRAFGLADDSAGIKVKSIIFPNTSIAPGKLMVAVDFEVMKKCIKIDDVQHVIDRENKRIIIRQKWHISGEKCAPELRRMQRIVKVENLRGGEYDIFYYGEALEKVGQVFVKGRNLPFIETASIEYQTGPNGQEEWYLSVRGHLNTPCHSIGKIEWEDSEDALHVFINVVDGHSKSKICPTVIKEFEIRELMTDVQRVANKKIVVHGTADSTVDFFNIE